MDENENSEQATRSPSKKRDSLVHSLQLSKKRVTLGDLTNSPIVTTESARDSDQEIRKSKCIAEENKSPVTESTLDLDARPRKPEHGRCVKKKRNQNDTEYSASTESTRKLELASSCCPSYMYGYLRSLEIDDRQRCLPNYMDEVQNDISVNMRGVLVDWMVEVAEEYKLVSDTLYLAVSYIDRFLSSKALSRNKLQLLGVTCMLIASKYEEICCPHVEDFCYVTDNTYTREEVVSMEKDVLKFLKYEMSTPTAKSFLGQVCNQCRRILTKAAQKNCKSANLQFEFLSCYLAELSLLEYGCLRFLPSVVAASAAFLSRLTIQPELHPWSMRLQLESCYGPSDLKECVLAIHNLQLNRKGSPWQPVRDKYSQRKFKCVATLSPPLEVPAHYFETADE